MSRAAPPAHPLVAANVAAIVAAVVTATVVVAAGALLTDRAHAQSYDAPTEYRIEVLVVEPVDYRSDDWPVDMPGRYDGALDPRVVAETATRLAPAWSAVVAPGVPIPQPLAERKGRVVLDDDSAPQDPDDAYRTLTRPALFTALEPLPGSLAELRVRLADSGEFEPVTALAWLQPAGRPRQPAPIRIHDDVVVDREAVPDPAIDRNEAMTGDGAGDGSAQQWRLSYRLDGSLALVRRQFLHAELDLQWQVPVQRLGELAPGASTMRIGPNDAASADGWRVHRLRQSRVIRPDRWEYFDSERFGVLLRVTELDPLLPLPPPEPAAPVDGGIEAAPRPQPADTPPDTAERARGR